MRCPTPNQPEPDLPPAIVAEIASILAAGYLKYRRSLAIPAVSAAAPPANRLSAASRKPPAAKAAVDVAHRPAPLRQSTHLPRGSPSVLTSPSPAGIAKNQTTHGRFLYFWLLSQKCNALTDRGRCSNKDWGRNVAKRRNELSPPFQRRGTVWGTSAAKRQHELLAAKPPMLAPRWAVGWSGSFMLPLRGAAFLCFMTRR